MTKKTVYTVYDNGKPADNISYPMLSDLEHCSKSSFDTFEEAEIYAKVWYKEEQEYLFDTPTHPSSFEIGVIYDYSGRGDVIEIR